MEPDINTYHIFSGSKCGLISMTQEKHVYDTQKGEFLFFYPKINKLTLHKITGINTEFNMPIVDFDNEIDWKVSDNKELQIALDIINEN